MNREDRSYYRARAEQEIDSAQRATHPKAVEAHYLIASMYLDRVHRRAEEGADPTSGAIDD